MFDYKKYLESTNFEGMQLEIFQSTTNKHVEIFGSKTGLLYLACKMIKFVEEDCAECDFAEMNLDTGVDLTDESSSLCIFVSRKDK